MDLQLETLLQLKGLAVVAWFALFFAAERLTPMAVNAPVGRGAWRRLGRNLGLFLVNIALSRFVVIPVSALAAAYAWDWRPAWWGGWGGLALDLLILDLWIYWWHRANHEIQLLWRFHEVHHLDTFLDTTSAVRFHFGEVLLSAGVRAVVIIALDIPLTSVLVFETVVLLAALFQHSNLRLPRGLERALTLVIVTPAWHWMHHHALRVDTDSNYGNLFSFWDRLFRSKCRHDRTVDMKIGVEGIAEKPLLPLLGRPFMPRRAAYAASSSTSPGP